MPTTGPEAAEALTTRRLRLRPMTRDDVPRAVRLAGVREVAERTLSTPWPYELADGYAWFEAHTGGESLFAIERLSDRLFVGLIGMTDPDSDAAVEIGYWLGREYWNRGYMSEAVERVVRHAFEDRGVDAVRGGAFPDNGASLRVLEKCGFRQVGPEWRNAPARGGRRMRVLYYERRREPVSAT